MDPAVTGKIVVESIDEKIRFANTRTPDYLQNACDSRHGSMIPSRSER